VNVEVIVNRQARHLIPDGGVRDVIVRAGARAGARVHETRDLGELDAAVRGIAARDARAVVLAGGDGSYMAGVSALARAFGPRLPAVALAPGGTVCTVARGLGLAGAAGEWAERAVRAACSGGASTVDQPTLRVRDGAAADRVAFVFGAGLVARFFDRYYEAGAGGVAAAVRIAARVAAGSLVGSQLARRVLSPVGCALEVDGVRQASRAWSLVLASVLPDVGLHIRATYRAGEEPGRFHVVASGRSPRGLATQLPRVLAGRPMRGGPRVDALARSLAVTFDDVGEYVLDGDVFTAHETRITTGPVVSVIRP
jgi:diacylglycerol kinase (ATP)